MNRREFLLAAAAATATLLVPKLSNALVADFWTRDRVLWLKLASTGEEFRVVYWSNGQLDYDNYARLCYILRDWHAREVRAMDVNLLNLMYGIQYWTDLELGGTWPLIIEIGLRTEQTNENTEGAAKDSEHKNMKAADVKHPVASPKSIGQKALFFQMGGVGFYSSITHIDTGRVRTFRGVPGRYKAPKSLPR